MAWKSVKNKGKVAWKNVKSLKNNHVMYKRKIEAVLEAWKNEPKRKPLVVKGVRQCGKTSSVKQFAYANYEHVVYMDFREDPALVSLFNNSLKVDYLTMTISAALPDAEFVSGKTCLILDEIQDCPRARGALKFLCLDGRYDVICTGSLLGVNGYKTKEQEQQEQQASIPVGFETIVEMYPMDFEEWLWANGIKSEVDAYLRECLEKEEPVGEGIHARMRQLMLEYAIVGGMPEAVEAFLTTHNINHLRRVQRAIVDEYKGDMVKYARMEDKPRIRECFESIPRQLSKENKKFQYSVVRPGGRSKDYLGCLQWIEDAGIIHRCYNLVITELPLDGNAMDEQFKVYMTDTGLFVSMLGEETQLDILRGNLLSYKGAIFENLMADLMGKRGMKMYYFHKESGLEIDFVMRYKDVCTLLECKANTGNAKSLQTVLKHPEKYHVYSALKFGDYNVGRNGALLTLPFYMWYLLW